MFKAITDLFNGSQPQQQPASQLPQNQGQPQGQPQSSGSQQIDVTQQKKNNPNQETAPLDAFNDLWKDKPADGGNVDPNNSATPQPKGKTAPQEPNFAEYAKKVNFSQALNSNPELVQKALQGDTQAFGQVINSVAQAVFAASLKSSHSMGASRETKFRESLIGELPSHFKSFAVANTPNENPAFNHPAFKPMVDVIKQQILQQFPDATPDDVNSKAKEYFTAVMETANPDFKSGKSQQQVPELQPSQARVAAQENGTFDWNKDLGLE